MGLFLSSKSSLSILWNQATSILSCNMSIGFVRILTDLLFMARTQMLLSIQKMRAALCETTVMVFSIRIYLNYPVFV